MLAGLLCDCWYCSISCGHFQTDDHGDHRPKNRGIKTRIQGSTIHPKNAQEKGQKPTKNLRTPTIITTEICCILHYMAT